MSEICINSTDSIGGKSIGALIINGKLKAVRIIIATWKTKDKKDIKDSERIYYPIKNKCQFSWYCDGKADEILVKNDNIKWKIAEDIAFNVLAFNKWSGIIGGATHYHATYVSPTWRKQMRLIGRIDDHIFYRWD